MLGLYTTGPHLFQADCNLDIVAKIGDMGKMNHNYKT